VTLEFLLCNVALGLTVLLRVANPNVEGGLHGDSCAAEHVWANILVGLFIVLGDTGIVATIRGHIERAKHLTETDKCFACVFCLAVLQGKTFVVVLILHLYEEPCVWGWCVRDGYATAWIVVTYLVFPCVLWR